MSKGKFVINFLFVLVTGTSTFSQDRADSASIAIHHNKIDDITRGKEIRSLLISIDSDFKRFSVNESLKFPDAECTRLARELQVRPFVKADFDGNGYTDLLVVGHYYEHRVLAILDSGENRFFIRFFPSKSTYNCTLPVVERKNGKLFINYYGDKERSWMDDTLSANPVSKLIYRFGDFIEYDSIDHHYNIEKIEYSTTPCFGTCPDFTLTITRDRNARFHAGSYNKLSGEFETVIDKGHYDKLIDLLNYIDFPNLKEHYSVNWTDDQTCRLIITYDGGKTKKIQDYGLQGTFGLMTLYKLLFALRDNQNWK